MNLIAWFLLWLWSNCQIGTHSNLYVRGDQTWTFPFSRLPGTQTHHCFWTSNCSPGMSCESEVGHFLSDGYCCGTYCGRRSWAESCSTLCPGVMATAVAAIVVETVVVGVIVISLATAAVTMVVILRFSSRHADGSGVGRDPASGCPYVGTEWKMAKRWGANVQRSSLLISVLG